MKTKNIFLSLLMLGVLSSSTAYAQLDLKDDIIATPNDAQYVLTREELKVQRQDFVNYITKFRSDVFVGFAQYSLSSINLSLKTHVKYTPELDGTISFQMATAGNHHIHWNSDVTFPMQAKVYFELKDGQNQYITFTEAANGDTVSFKGQKNVLYLVETEAGFKTRKNVQSKYMKEGKAIGRFFAKVIYDLYTQDIEFYELDDSQGNENVLVRRGHFKGNVSPSRTGF